MVQLLYVGVAAVAVGVIVYNVWGTQISNSIPTPTSSKDKDVTLSTYKAPKPASAAYTPSGEAQTWSEDDMRKFLSSRNMDPGHHSSKEELLAMVMAKLNEPTSTGFDDPSEWSAEDMRSWLKENKMDPGHSASRMELLAMVESKMHEPKSTGFDDPTEWSAEDMRTWLKENHMDPGHHASRLELLAMVESKMHEPK